MRRAISTFVPLLILTAACGGSADIEQEKPFEVTSSAPTSRPMPDDTKIMGMVYDNLYRVPDGFFVDDRASTPRSFSLYHVKDASNSFELCSDNVDEARGWEDADNASRSVQGVYVGSIETNRYFEFVRELSFDNDIGNIDELTSPGFARVFKCNHTSRDGVDRSILSGFAGQLNKRPLTANDITVFAEYLWQFTFFPQARKKVLESYNTEDADSFKQTLLLAFSTNQGTGRCDLIEVVEWTFSADKTTGNVSKSFETMHTFEAELVSATPRICD